MTTAPARTYWRVGYHLDPTGFVPLELCSFNHRFDDLEQRFRSVYVSELAETGLREVLADLRPNAAALRRYVERFGPAAARDIPARPVTARWRQQHVLVEVAAVLDGPLIDLTDPDVRHDVERRHVALLARHGLEHLDLTEITTKRRPVTQAIASDLHDNHGAAAVRFPSRLDGNPCLAVFEGRGALEAIAEPIRLVDPAPEALLNVCAGWNLPLEPAGAPAAG